MILRDIWTKRLQFHQDEARELSNKLRELDIYNEKNRNPRQKRGIFQFLLTFANPILNLLKGVGDLAKFAFHHQQIKSTKKKVGAALITAKQNR